MSLTRLSFLYPHLFKTAKVCECNLPRRPPRRGEKRSPKSTFSTSAQHRHETYAQRYGTAAEPQPPPIPATDGLGESKTLANTIEKDVKTPIRKQQERKSDPNQAKEATNANHEVQKIAEKSLKSQSSPTDNSAPASKLDSGEFLPREAMKPTIGKEPGKSLETVLHMEAQDTKGNEEHKPHHLQAPPYVHHFDTFTLVSDLQKGGFTEAQSVTLMKAVRSLLATNLDIARESLVSKSDIENVRRSYFYQSRPPSSNWGLSLSPHSLTIHLENRKPISSAPPAPNSAPKSSTPVKPAHQKWPHNGPIYSTKSTSCLKKRHRTAWP